MTGEKEALELWGRSLKSIRYAEMGVELTPDAVADTITHFHVPMDVLLETPEEIDRDYLEYIGAVVFAA